MKNPEKTNIFIWQKNQKYENELSVFLHIFAIMKKRLLSLFFALILWVPSALALMPHEAQIEFRNAAEAIISKVEQRLTENKESTNVINYREQILNPNLSEAREFIQGLWLPEADMLTLMQYSIISNEKPIEDLNWIPQAEVFRQLEEMGTKALVSQTHEMMYSPIINNPYNRHAAVVYAKQWALGHNPQYPYFSNNGDCTNFVSQALRAGGLNFIVGRWDWATYWFFWDINNLSMTWSTAHSLVRHMQETPSRYTIANSVNDLKIGDIIAVEYDNTGIFRHLMMVTEGQWWSVKVSYHSNDTKDKPFTEFMIQSPNATRYLFIKVN